MPSKVEDNHYHLPEKFAWDWLWTNQLKIGKEYKVLFDRIEGEYFIGRTEFDSPEVDNEVLVKKEGDVFVRIGDFASVQITSADHYDLYGKLVWVKV